MSERVRMEESILDYILEIIKETRNPKFFELGVSPRGAIALKSAAQARALTDGRSYCIPDDVKEMAVAVLAHRIVVRNEHTMGQEGKENALNEVLQRVRVPI